MIFDAAFGAHSVVRLTRYGMDLLAFTIKTTSPKHIEPVGTLILGLLLKLFQRYLVNILGYLLSLSEIAGSTIRKFCPTPTLALSGARSTTVWRVSLALFPSLRLIRLRLLALWSYVQSAQRVISSDSFVSFQSTIK